MMESFNGDDEDLPDVPLAAGSTAGDAESASAGAMHNAVAALAGVPKALPEEKKQESSTETQTLISEASQIERTFSAEDDDMGEASEAFVDEPMEESHPPARTKSPKRGRRNRAKASSVTFSTSQTTPQTSYWSASDDDTRSSKAKKGGNMASRLAAPFSGRTKKSRNKRRTRRHQEEQGGSSSEDGPKTKPQRKPSPLPTPTKTPPKPSPKPPISVVRTKSKAKVSAVPNNQTDTNGSNPTTPRIKSASPVPQQLSIEDMEIFQRLDDEYENALEERHIGYMARYTSVRQAACLSVVFMLIFLSLGTTFFMNYANWTMQDSLLFSIYTITTVGYGNQTIPKQNGFQSFTILYIFVGIAMLTIMVAQVYQCIALEASRAQHSRDKTEMARRGLGPEILSRRNQQQHNDDRVNSSGASATSSVTHDAGLRCWEEWECFDDLMQYYERAKRFFAYNEYGRSFSVLLPFAGLVLIGAIVVGPLEGWNVIEALYFAVVSLTTVGFGDYYPRHVASVWFCILWLPFSVGFMSMFLKNVATFYIRLSAQNINRIERRMRRRVARAKEQYECDRAEAVKRAYHGQAQSAELELELRRFPGADPDDVRQGNRQSSPSSSQASRHSAHSGSSQHRGRRQGKNSQFDVLPTAPEDSSVAAPVVKASRASLFGSPGEDEGVLNRRERILKNSLGGNQDDYRPKGKTMDTMKDLIEAVHKSIASGSSDSRYLSMRSSVMKPVLGDSNEPMRKPSFALRLLVQERFAEIIATDIAGYQSSIEIKENTLSVTIDTLRETAEKWHIPRRARKAFRAVAFEALYFVGEHGLITKGAKALFALTPFEFHGLFSPLLAALGDAGTMEDWLASTEVLAEYDLKNKEGDGNNKPGDVETGSGERAAYPTTEERLHTARNRNKAESSSNLQGVNIGGAFA